MTRILTVINGQRRKVELRWPPIQCWEHIPPQRAALETPTVTANLQGKVFQISFDNCFHWMSDCCNKFEEFEARGEDRIGMSTGRGRKRAGNGSSGNSPSGMQQGHRQVRQGSSFWTCPACGTAVHTALTSFHLSSCPVLAADSTSAPAKTKGLPRQLTAERREDGSGQCPESVSGSTSKRGIGLKKSPWEEEDEDEDNRGNVYEEERLGDVSSPSPLFMGKKLSLIPGTPNPKTPIQEVGEPRVACLVESSKGDHTAKARKRLFEDWGQRLSPEPEANLAMRLSPINSAAPPTPFTVDPQTQRSKVMTPTLYGRDPVVVDLVESPMRDQTAEARKRLFEDWGQDLSPEAAPELYLGVDLSPVNAAAAPCCVNPQTQRSEVMNPSLHEGEPVVVGLMKSPKRDQTAEARKRVFEDWGQELSPEAAPELDLGVDLSPVNAASAPCSVDPQTQRSEVINPSLHGGEPVGIGLMKSPKRDQTAEARKRLFDDWGQKLSPEPARELDLGVDLSPVNAAAAPCSIHPQTQRSEVINPSLHGGEPVVVGLMKSPKRDHAREPSERLFEDDGTKSNSGILDDKSPIPLPCSTTAAALLAPNTPGRALVKPAGEHEERDGVGGDDRCNLYTMGNQRTEGTPGGGPKTPEDCLISELLDSFPPAQGIETHVGIDPFNDNFPDIVNIDTSNGSSALKNDPIPKQEDGQTFVSDGDHGKVLLDNERLNKSKASALPQASENSQEEIGPLKKRRKPALVIESDSDEDIRDRSSAPDVGNSRKIIEDGILSGTEGYKLDSGMGMQVCNPGANSHPDPVMAVSTEDRSLEQRIPSSPPINVLFGTEGEEDAFGNLAAGSRHMVNKSCSSSTPDPITEILRKDRELFSPPSVDVVLPSDEEKDFCESIDKSCSSSTPDPITEILRKDRELFSPPSVNVVLSSDEEKDFCKSTGGSVKKVKRKVNVVLSSDEEEDICESSRGSGTKGKRRRLVKVQESSDGSKTQPDPNSEKMKEIGTDKLRRRSERLRNVYTSGPTQTALLSKQDGESDSDEERSEALGTNGQRSSFKAQVLDNDDDPIEIDTDSSDGGPTGVLHKIRKVIGTQKQDADDEDGDGDGDIETDENDFINDDPESDGDPRSLSSVDEISESGEESENEDSSANKSSSERHKKYKWDLEGDMLAALAKDTELCLRGLCAIYRRQEEDEKMLAASKYQNKRGFNTFHTPRASRIASFLMGDTTVGPMVKTVEELNFRFREDAVTYCRDLCIHYSKQLFEIYQNNEDPYFPEPCTDSEM